MLLQRASARAPAACRCRRRRAGRPAPGRRASAPSRAPAACLPHPQAGSHCRPASSQQLVVDFTGQLAPHEAAPTCALQQTQRGTEYMNTIRSTGRCRRCGGRAARTGRLLLLVLLLCWAVLGCGGAIGFISACRGRVCGALLRAQQRERGRGLCSRGLNTRHVSAQLFRHERRPAAVFPAKITA